MLIENHIAVSYGPFEAISRQHNILKLLYLSCGKTYKKEFIQQNFIATKIVQYARKI